MWKKASLPQILPLLLLLLLLLNALLFVQLGATESTQPTLDVKDSNTNGSSSTDHSGAQAYDEHHHDDDDVHNWDEEAIVETYDGDEEESSEVIRKATPLHFMINPAAAATNNKNDEVDETNVHDSDYHDAGEIVDLHDDGSGGSGDYVDGSSDGSGVGGVDDIEIDEVERNSDGDSVAVATTSEEEEDGEAELTELDISERKRIASIMLRELSKILDYALEQQRSVVNEFLQDETIEMVKCATMEQVKKSCTAFMGGVRNALELDKGEDLLMQLVSFGLKTLTAFNFDQFVQQHNTTRIEEPTAENVIINNALKKAGIVQLELELQKRFLEFSKFFNATVSDYVKRRLPQLLQQQQQPLPEQPQINDKLVLWYGEFVVASDVNSQVLALSKFFPMYKKILLDAINKED